MYYTGHQCNLKMAVFWVVAPCSLVEVYQRFRGTCCLHHEGDDGSSMYHRNVGKLLPDYTALQLRRQPMFILAAVRTSNPTQCNLYTYSHNLPNNQSNPYSRVNLEKAIYRVSQKYVYTRSIFRIIKCIHLFGIHCTVLSPS
jgi:hypothetical protein